MNFISFLGRRRSTSCQVMSLIFYMLLHLSQTRWYMKKKNVPTPLRSQERPLSFLKGHVGDGVLPGMLWASFLICCFIYPQQDDTRRWIMSWLHSGVRNVLIASLKDMEETEYFLPSYELLFLYATSCVPNKMKDVLTPLRSQERSLCFLKGHVGDGVLPGM